MKVQFLIEQGLLPYIIQDVPHKIIEVNHSEQSLRIEVEINSFTMINLLFAAKAFGMGMAINGLTEKISEAA